MTVNKTPSEPKPFGKKPLKIPPYNIRFCRLIYVFWSTFFPNYLITCLTYTSLYYLDRTHLTELRVTWSTTLWFFWIRYNICFQFSPRYSKRLFRFVWLFINKFEFSPHESTKAWSIALLLSILYLFFLIHLLYISSLVLLYLLSSAYCVPRIHLHPGGVCDPLTREHYSNDTQSNEMTPNVWFIVCAYLLLKITLLT